MATTFIPKIEFGSGPTTIEFDFPQRRPKVVSKKYKHVGTITKSKSGKQQTITDFIEVLHTVDLSHISEALGGEGGELEVFFETHALLGKSFDYFFDKGDVATKQTFKMDRSFSPELREQAPVTTATFIYKVKLKLRRVI